MKEPQIVMNWTARELVAVVQRLEAVGATEAPYPYLVKRLAAMAKREGTTVEALRARTPYMPLTPRQQALVDQLAFDTEEATRICIFCGWIAPSIKALERHEEGCG